MSDIVAKINELLPPGESLSAFRTSVEQALERCKKTHRKYPSGYYNMNVGTARVTRVGIMVDEDGDASYWADIDDANCPLLARDIRNDVGPDLDLPCEVRTEW